MILIAKDGIDLSTVRRELTDQVTVDGKLYELPFRSDFSGYCSTIRHF